MCCLLTCLLGGSVVFSWFPHFSPRFLSGLVISNALGTLSTGVPSRHALLSPSVSAPPSVPKCLSLTCDSQAAVSWLTASVSDVLYPTSAAELGCCQLTEWMSDSAVSLYRWSFLNKICLVNSTRLSGAVMGADPSRGEKPHPSLRGNSHGCFRLH